MNITDDDIKLKEAFKALNCLFLVVDEKVAKDVWIKITPILQEWAELKADKFTKEKKL